MYKKFITLFIFYVFISFAKAQKINTVAGGFTGDGGPAIASSLNIWNENLFVQGIAIADNGDIYISDFMNHRVRKITKSTGDISTIAGNGTSGFSGDGGPGIAAQLNYPVSVTIDSAENIFILDLGNVRIRKIDKSTGNISTIAGSGTIIYSGDNGPAINAQFNAPFAISSDRLGALYILDKPFIRKIKDGIITKIAGGGSNIYSNGIPAIQADLFDMECLVADSAGNVFTSSQNRIRKITNSSGLISNIAGSATGVYGYSGDNGLASQALLNRPNGLAIDRFNNIYIAEENNKVIRKIINDSIKTVAGNGNDGYTQNGDSAVRPIRGPEFIAVDRNGDFYFSDQANSIRKVTDGILSTIAGNTVFSNIVEPPVINRGDGLNATDAQLNWPADVAVDDSGNIYIADLLNCRIRKVSMLTNKISTIAGNGSFGYNGDGISAVSAQLAFPSNITLDTAGNIFIRDNNRIRKITKATGLISTFAGTGSIGFNGDNILAVNAKIGNSGGMSFDKNNILYFADDYNNRIRIIRNDSIFTIAGTGVSGFSGDNGSALIAKLNSPSDVAIDTSGNIYISDNLRIRKITKSNGNITTISGNGLGGSSGDGGLAINAYFDGLEGGLAIDGRNNLYVADYCRIRKISNDSITTITGNGIGGFNGDGGLAVNAQIQTNKLDAYYGISTDSSGNIYLAEVSSNRIRKIYNSKTYTFSGNGDWAIASNWDNNEIPTTTLPAGTEIIINPAAGGECTLTTPVTIPPMVKLTISSNAKFRVNGNLIINND